MHDQRLRLSTREKAFHAFLVIATRSFNVGTGSRGWDLEPLLQKSFIFFQPRVKQDCREGKTNETPAPGDLMQEASGGLLRLRVAAHLTLLTWSWAVKLQRCGAHKTPPCCLAGMAVVMNDTGSALQDAWPWEHRLLPDTADTSQQTGGPRRLQPVSPAVSCSLRTSPLLTAAFFSWEVKILREDS